MYEKNDLAKELKDCEEEDLLSAKEEIYGPNRNRTGMFSMDTQGDLVRETDYGRRLRKTTRKTSQMENC